MTANLPTPVIEGNQSPVPGSQMLVDNLVEDPGTPYPVAAEAGVWPGSNTGTFYAISHTWLAGSVPDVGPTPLSTLFIYNNVEIADADSPAAVFDSVARVEGSRAWGSNSIARSGGGGITVKLVGNEIDVQYVENDQPTSDAGGLFINTSGGSPAGNGPGIMLGSLDGQALWSNGLGITACLGAGLFVANGYGLEGSSRLLSLVYADGTAFSYGAVVIGNNANPAYNQFIRWKGPAGADALAQVDGAGRFLLSNAGGDVQLDAAAGHQVTLSSAGTVVLQALSAIQAGQTNMLLLVNTGSGVRLVQVTPGPANSGGQGRRMLTIPG